VKFNLYSEYPFKPKSNRVLTPKQKEILKYTQESEDGLYIGRDVIDGVQVLRVAVTDFMTAPSCVSCHNTHPDRTWGKNKWKLGDKRGVLEVITPLTEALEANSYMRMQILVFITVMLILLVLYFSYTLIKRETELLDENEILDAKVKVEVEKNIHKEKQLIIQNRSAALGDMLAAIIHQWKQPLSGISMSNSAMQLDIAIGTLSNDGVLKHTTNIESQILNMNKTMDDFRDFFKPKNEACYKISDSINDVLKFIEKVYKIQNINIKTKLDENVMTSGFSNELNQVIINILNNARDAILENNCEIKDINIEAFIQNNKSIISITDYAGGIPEHIIENIFDPYVTTKSDENGTGIGLDMSKTIIEKVNGKIEANNVISIIDGKEYKGANFKIILNGCTNC